VDYAHIAVLDAAAIQEQQGKIESLKEQLDSLKAANDNLQREVAVLKGVRREKLDSICT
jgi:cell division protein FtsB